MTDKSVEQNDPAEQTSDSISKGNDDSKSSSIKTDDKKPTGFLPVNQFNSFANQMRKDMKALQNALTALSSNRVAGEDDTDGNAEVSAAKPLVRNPVANKELMELRATIAKSEKRRQEIELNSRVKDSLVEGHILPDTTDAVMALLIDRQKRIQFNSDGELVWIDIDGTEYTDVEEKISEWCKSSNAERFRSGEVKKGSGGKKPTNEKPSQEKQVFKNKDEIFTYVGKQFLGGTRSSRKGRKAIIIP